jgi:predicted nucleic acid-binding protein
MKNLGPNATLAITSPSMYELYSGIYLVQYGKKAKKSQSFIDAEIRGLDRIKKALIQVEFSTESAKLGAEIFYRLCSKGETIDLFDCMIAGTILSHGDCEIITKNVNHFQRIEGLKLIPIDY